MWSDTSTDQNHTVGHKNQNYVFYLKPTRAARRLTMGGASAAELVVPQPTPSSSTHRSFPNRAWAPHVLWPAILNIFPSAASKIPIYLMAASRAEPIWHCHEQTVISCPVNS